MPVFCELDMGKVHFTKSNVSYRNLSAINLDALRADLSNSDLCINTDLSDIHELVKSYNETLESVINRHAPLRTKTIIARPHVPWFNNEVKSVKRERRRAERKWRRTRQLCDFQIYKSKKNYMMFVMNRSRKNIIQTLSWNMARINGNYLMLLSLSIIKEMILIFLCTMIRLC